MFISLAGLKSDSMQFCPLFINISDRTAYYQILASCIYNQTVAEYRCLYNQINDEYKSLRWLISLHLASHSESERVNTFISAFIGARHCACSYNNVQYYGPI